MISQSAWNALTEQSLYRSPLCSCNWMRVFNTPASWNEFFLPLFFSQKKKNALTNSLVWFFLVGFVLFGWFCLLGFLWGFVGFGVFWGFVGLGLFWIFFRFWDKAGIVEPTAILSNHGFFDTEKMFSKGRIRRKGKQPSHNRWVVIYLILCTVCWLTVLSPIESLQ